MTQDRALSVRETSDATDVGLAFERTQQLTQRPLAFAANEKIELVFAGISVWRQARIVAARHDSGRWPNTTNEPSNFERGGALKGHHREPDKVGLQLVDELFHGFRDA